MSTRHRSRSISIPLRYRQRRPSRVRQFFAPFYVTVQGFVRSTFRAIGGMWGQATAAVNRTTSWGGTEITPEIALTIGAVWACAWRYAMTSSTLPLQLKKTGSGNSATVAFNHPLYGLLHDRPNTQMSAASFRKALSMSAMLWGAGYAKKVRLKPGGPIVALIPKRPEYMTTYLAVDGTLRWSYRPPAAPVEDFGIDDLFVIMDRTIDGYTPASRLEYARHSMGLALSADRAAALAWKNGLRASAVLMIDKVLKPGQREEYQTALEAFQGTGAGDGLDRQGGIFVAEAATKLESLNLKATDLELLASRQFSVEDVCRWYDTPPVLVGHASQGQTMWGSGIEQIVLGWLKFGLGPYLTTWEQEINRQLLLPGEQGAYFAEHNLEALLRGDSAARANFISSMLQNGVYNRDHVRAFESLPPAPGGDVYTVQSNLVPVDKLGALADANVRKATLPVPPPAEQRAAQDLSINVATDHSLQQEMRAIVRRLDAITNRPPAAWRQIPHRGADGRIEYVRLIEEK